MPALWRQLRERKVIQWTAAYLAVAWVLYQVLTLVGQNFEWPKIVLQVTTIVLLAGTPLAMVLAWYHGERGRQRVSGPELLMIVALLTIAGASVAFVARPAAPAAEVESGPASPADPEHNSLAVLPLENLSDDPAEDYFSDGLTEELLSALYRLPDLRLAARTSSFHFKGQHLPVDEIARRLNVAHVLEGSVRQHGNQLRIRVQLVNALTGFTLWSETFDRPTEDVFVVQDEIARAVADALRIRLASQDEPLVAGATTDLEAHRLYLQGRFAWNSRTQAGMESAAGLFRAAIERDPTYALAFAGLADSYVLLGGYNFMRPSDAVRLARAAADRALELDESLAEAHTSRAQTFYWERRFEEAETGFRRAIALNPNYATAHHWFANVVRRIGRTEEALASIRRAQELDPLSPIISLVVGNTLLAAREHEAAAAQYRRTLQIHPGFQRARAALGRVLVDMGQHDEGVMELRRANALLPDDPSITASLAHSLATAGLVDEAFETLESHGPIGYAAAAASVHAALGEADEAFRWLEQGLADDPATLIDLRWDPVFDPIRADPRFTTVLQRLGLARRP